LIGHHPLKRTPKAFPKPKLKNSANPVRQGATTKNTNKKPTNLKLGWVGLLVILRVNLSIQFVTKFTNNIIALR
jgi:hypothetical protein